MRSANIAAKNYPGWAGVTGVIVASGADVSLELVRKDTGFRAPVPNHLGVTACILGWLPPLKATIYQLQKLRCHLCGEVFTAAAPQEVGERKYDATAGSMIVCPSLIRDSSGIEPVGAIVISRPVRPST